MIEKIKNHITVFGDKFVVTEIAVVALVVGYMAIFFLLHTHYALVFIASGITLNCLTMLGFSIRAIAIRSDRKKSQTDEKRTLKDTLVLSAAIIIPFILLIVVVYEKWNYRRK